MSFPVRQPIIVNFEDWSGVPSRAIPGSRRAGRPQNLQSHVSALTPVIVQAYHSIENPLTERNVRQIPGLGSHYRNQSLPNPSIVSDYYPS